MKQQLLSLIMACFVMSLTAQVNISSIKSTPELDGKYYIHLTFEKVPPLAYQNELKANGVRLLEYHGDMTYLASVEATTSLSQIDAKRSQAIHAEDKADYSLRNNSLPPYAIEGSNAKLVIKHPEDLSQSYVINRLKRDQVEVIRYNGENNFIEIKTPISNLNKLINAPYVIGVEPVEPPSIKDDKTGRSLHRVNLLNSRNGLGRNWTGDGVNVMVRDDGAVFEHIDFTGRMDQSSVGETRGDHGDGVAGIMVGAGNLDPDMQGMAYGSDFWVTDYVASFLDETMSLFRNQNVVITNSSYSNGCNGGYTFATQTVDQQMFQNPTMMHVFSAGNSNGNDCGYGAGTEWGNITGGHKIGKNVIAVANTNNLGVIAGSSSKGPAFDGRIKPDIAANGLNHFSTDENQGYRPFGGTSAAAPVVAGVSAMLYDGYQELYGELPPAALIKAIMLNTASEIGNIGPDYTFGWGLLNANRAARVIEDQRWIEGEIAQEEVITHAIEIPENVAQVKIMTYWPDQQGTTTSGNHLINDIDTRFNLPGVTHMPWVLNDFPSPDSLAKEATRGEDHKNNMEQISIDNPPTGTFNLVLNGNFIPLGTAKYYVVIEYIYNEIEITYPNGGENLIRRAREIVRFDAHGNDGEFQIEILGDDGEPIVNTTVNGARRYANITIPNTNHRNAKLVVSRDGLSDTSDYEFVISNEPASLRVEEEDGQRMFTWSEVPGAESYMVYLLGEKYMEPIQSVDTTVFEIPNEPQFKFGWIAVAPVFSEGYMGQRTVAIPVRSKPTAVVDSDLAGRNPCVGEPVTFFTPSADTLMSYEWNFGRHSDPEESFEEGPHTVTYTRRGKKIGYLRIEHEGGSDSEFFEISVQRAIEGGEIFAEALGFGEYTFATDIQNVDSVLWDMGDGTQIFGAPDETINYTYTQDGDFTVTMTSYSDCIPLIKTTSVFSSTTTSTDDITAALVEILPNPNQGDFKIVLNKKLSQDTPVYIISASGQQVRSFIMSSQDQPTIDINGLPSGVYIVRIAKESNPIVRKIVVE